ncbi:MAG TPA: hypothetical protein VK612_07780 [Pyrinomonadaceae bacterium]|nr:hypothetical protein [Pyrinomonadaceae bacterium]
MAIKVEKYAVGDQLPMMCSACDSDQSHTVQTVTKLGKITSAICDTCQTASTFKGGVKTSVAVGSKGKTAGPYDRTRRYKKGQAMMHDKFGHGEVTAVLEPQKIDVLFGDMTRRLIHSQE